MQWLLRYEANACDPISRAYRYVHGEEAPVPAYAERTSIYSIPEPQW